MTLLSVLLSLAKNGFPVIALVSCCIYYLLFNQKNTIFLWTNSMYRMILYYCVSIPSPYFILFMKLFLQVWICLQLAF